jgi:hypothetical protein
MFHQENQHDVIARLLMEKLELEDDSESQVVILRLLVNLAISLNEDHVRNPLLDTLRRVKAVSAGDC